MRTMVWILSAVLLAVMFAGYVPQNNAPAHTGVPAHDTLYTYQKDILPLLQKNCNPCHFPGGKVYKKLPFDDYKTVAALGKKLNTRFKEKQQQAIVNGWTQFGSKEK